jgi:pimeloyl-ACP methyl ester carboxylesterase
MYLDPKRLFIDDVVEEGTALAYCDQLELRVEGSGLHGEIYLPDGSYPGRRPCVCLFHGFPGSVVNDDLAQALRRMGCAVIRMFQRGAWGSEGWYSFSNNVADAVAIAQWAMGPGAERYPIQPKAIFLVGHSVGGQTVISAARRMPEILGTVALAPMDIGRLMVTGQQDKVQALLDIGSGFLRQEYEGAWMENVEQHWREMTYAGAAEELRSRNLLLVGALQDDVAVPKEMVLPLWEALSKLETDACQEMHLINAGHSFCSSRLAMTDMVGRWITKVCQEKLAE